MSGEEHAQVALLTGATGFVGSHLARRLCRDGWHVHVIVRPSSRLTMLEGMAGRLTVHSHDGTTESMSSIFEKTRPGVVFHLASLYLTEHQANDVKPLIESNILFGAQLLESMANHGIRCLVNTGTAWQHYEDSDYNPVNLYAATKQAFEAIFRYYIEVESLRSITLKLFDTFGPSDPRRKLFRSLREAAQSGQRLMMSAGEQLLDLVHIDDVVDAFILAASRLQTGMSAAHEVYAISSGAPSRLRDVVCAWERGTGQPLTIEWGGRPYRRREVMVPWTRGASLPGWRPRRSLSAWLREERLALPNGGDRDGI